MPHRLSPTPSKAPDKTRAKSRRGADARDPASPKPHRTPSSPARLRDAPSAAFPPLSLLDVLSVLF